MAIEYSFVIPIYDEETIIDELYSRLAPVMDALDGPCEAVLVDDGSTDGSYEAMVKLHERDARVKPLRLSRNFGQQIALTAGIDRAQGRAVIIMDGDLQDPPEVALQLAERWREGYDVVYAVRERRTGDSPMKRATARWFYRVLRRVSDVDMPADVGDFRLVDRRAVDAVTAMREHRRYLRGMFAWVGYNQTGVRYDRAPRHHGTTKFPVRKMLAFARDGVVSFSAAPLRVALNVGAMLCAGAVAVGIAGLALALAGVYRAPGWAGIVVGAAFLGGLQLAGIGVLGEYIASIHEEVMRRPLYLVRDEAGFDAADRSDVRTTRR